MCDTGQIAIDRANARIAREEEAAENTPCWKCEHCVWTADDLEGPSCSGKYRFGWCEKNEWLLTQSDLDTTIAEWGCSD